jgi:hypothetical protein
MTFFGGRNRRANSTNFFTTRLPLRLMKPKNP